MFDNETGAAPSMQPQQTDGSIDQAVAAMADFDDDNLISFEDARDGRQPQPRSRDDIGRFAEEKKEKAPSAVDMAKVAADNAAAKAAEEAAAKAAAAAVSSPEEEYFELPPETEGAEPRRIPATEVFEGYQKSQEYLNELQEAKRTAPPPAEYDRQIYETVQARNRVLQELQTYESLLRPQQPDIDLLNPNSPKFNADLYYQQVQMSQQMNAQLQAVQQQRMQHQTALEREQAALSQARYARERGKLSEIWPEVLNNPQKASQVRDAAQRYYGIDDETFKTTIDSRLYAILKDALAYKEATRAQQTVAKIVRGKPTLVRAAARPATAQNQTVTNTAMRRVARSNSIDDAADAIGSIRGLLG